LIFVTSSGINIKLTRVSIAPHGVIEELGTIKKFDFRGDQHFHNNAIVVVALFKTGKTMVQVNTCLNLFPPQG
jgi:hypothetical protein